MGIYATFIHHELDFHAIPFLLQKTLLLSNSSVLFTSVGSMLLWPKYPGIWFPWIQWRHLPIGLTWQSSVPLIHPPGPSSRPYRTLCPWTHWSSYFPQSWGWITITVFDLPLLHPSSSYCHYAAPSSEGSQLLFLEFASCSEDLLL